VLVFDIKFGGEKYNKSHRIINIKDERFLNSIGSTYTLVDGYECEFISGERDDRNAERYVM